MTDRDKIIDEKLDSLKKQKATIEEKLAGLPEYITNLRVSDGHSTVIYNLRTVTSPEQFGTLLSAFSIINRLHKDIIDFSEFIGKDYDRQICGYKWEAWQQDFRTLYSKAVLNTQLNKVNSAIKDIEIFYSSDKKEEIAFKDFLNDINDINID